MSNGLFFSPSWEGRQPLSLLLNAMTKLGSPLRGPPVMSASGCVYARVQERHRCLRRACLREREREGEAERKGVCQQTAAAARQTAAPEQTAVPGDTRGSRARECPASPGHMRSQQGAAEGGSFSSSSGSSGLSPGSDSDSGLGGPLAGVGAARGVMSHYWSLESLHSTTGKAGSMFYWNKVAGKVWRGCTSC